MGFKIDPDDLHWFMGVKFVIAVSIIKFSPSTWIGILALIAVTLSYKHLVALIHGVHVIDVNDLICFQSDKKANCNVMSATPVSPPKTELTKEAFSRIVHAHLKARS